MFKFYISNLTFMKRNTLFLLSSLVLICLLLNTTNCQISLAYDTELDFSGNIIAFDISHGGYHAEDVTNLMGNLTATGNTVFFINETWILPDNVSALFLTQPDDVFSLDEKQDIKNWFDLGDKLIFGCGDSDYGGYYNSVPIDEVMLFLDAQIMIDDTSIEDPVMNDGSAYRAAATEYGTSMTAIAASENCSAGIIVHGPCSILGYNGTNYIDLRSESLTNVEVLVSYSVNSTSIDSDVSEGEKDLYAGEVGYMPAVVYEKIDVGSGNYSHIVLAGEAIYSNYKFMYDQVTENGAYNGGTHYGQMFVNNILNYFLDTIVAPPPETTPTPSETLVGVEFLAVVVSLLSIGVFTVYIFRKKR